MTNDSALPNLGVLHEYLCEGVYIDRGYCETCAHDEAWDWNAIDAMVDYCVAIGVNWLGVVDTSAHRTQIGGRERRRPDSPRYPGTSRYDPYSFLDDAYDDADMEVDTRRSDSPDRRTRGSVQGDESMQEDEPTVERHRSGWCWRNGVLVPQSPV